MSLEELECKRFRAKVNFNIIIPFSCIHTRGVNSGWVEWAIAHPVLGS